MVARFRPPPLRWPRRVRKKPASGNLRLRAPRSFSTNSAPRIVLAGVTARVIAFGAALERARELDKRERQLAVARSIWRPAWTTVVYLPVAISRVAGMPLSRAATTHDPMRLTSKATNIRTKGTLPLSLARKRWGIRCDYIDLQFLLRQFYAECYLAKSASAAIPRAGFGGLRYQAWKCPQQRIRPIKRPAPLPQPMASSSLNLERAITQCRRR